MTSCPRPEQMTAFLQDNFKGLNHPVITQAETGRVSLHLTCGPSELRPGGFISGPTMMTLADTAGLMGVFSHTGMTTPAFTTSLSIDFLRPGQGERLIATANVVKFGRTLSIINVTLKGSDMHKHCAQAVVTYATTTQSAPVTPAD